MDLLKQILRQHGMPLSGQKNLLVARLKELYRVKYVTSK